MSLTTKQEHVTTTCALCMISKWHKQHRFRSASPRPCLEFSLPRLGLELSASASALPRLCLDLSASTSASASTKLPRAHPWTHDAIVTVRNLSLESSIVIINYSIQVWYAQFIQHISNAVIFAVLKKNIFIHFTAWLQFPVCTHGKVSPQCCIVQTKI